MSGTIQIKERSSKASSPPIGDRKIYPKSDGWYILDSNGLELKLNDVSGADVIGSGASTDNAVVRFSGATGKIIKNSGVIVDNSNNASGFGTIDATGNITIDKTGVQSIITIRSDQAANLDTVSEIIFSGHDDGANDHSYGKIYSTILNNVDGSEQGNIKIDVADNGSGGALLNVANFDNGGMTTPLNILATGTIVANGAFLASTNITGTGVLNVGTNLNTGTSSRISFRGLDSGSNLTIYAQEEVDIITNTDTLEDGKWTFKLMQAGTLTPKITVETTLTTHQNDVKINQVGSGAILTLQSDGVSGNKVIGVYPNDDPVDKTFGEVEIFLEDPSAGDEGGKILFRTMVSGSLDQVGQFDHEGHFLVGSTAFNVNGVNDTVGIGTVPISTTFLAIDAGTTAKSQINFVDGVAPSSPNDGDIFRVGDALFFRQTGVSVDLTNVGTGDVVGPAGVSDNTLVRFDGTTGKLIQQASQILIDDSANVSGFRDLSLTGTSITMDTGAVSSANLTLRSGATTVGGVITFSGHDSGGADTDYARIRGLANDSTDPNEDGKMLFQVLVNNSETTIVEINETTTDVAAGDFLVGSNIIQVGSSNAAMGIGQVSNSAHFLGIAAGTTAKAQINFTDGVAPSSPNTGDLFKVGDALFFRQAGVSVDLTTNGGPGDVTGPGSSADNAIVRFDSTTGKLIQGSSVLIDDNDQLIDAASISAGDGITSSSGTDANHINVLVGTNSTPETNGISFYETNADPAFAMHLGYDGTGSGDANFIAVYDSDGDVIIQFLNGETIQLAAGTDVGEFSTDGTMAGNSNDAVPTEAAIVTYVEDHAGVTPTYKFLQNSTVSVGVMTQPGHGTWVTSPIGYPIQEDSEVIAIALCMGSSSASSSGSVTVTVRQETSARGSAHALGGGTSEGTATFSFGGSAGVAFERTAESVGLANGLTQGNLLHCDVSTKSASVSLTDLTVHVITRNT